MSTFLAVHFSACPKMFCIKSYILPRCGDCKGQLLNAALKDEVFTDFHVSCGQSPLLLEGRFIFISALRKATPSQTLGLQSLHFLPYLFPGKTRNPGGCSYVCKLTRKVCSAERAILATPLHRGIFYFKFFFNEVMFLLQSLTIATTIIISYTQS